MTDDRRAIWNGDKLGRRGEALDLQNFLDLEVMHLRVTKRNHGFVLGLDAPYGEGKTWFLERFAKQLELDHPVVRVDAWADDAGNEPLVALMASIEDTLAPFLSKPTLRNKFQRARAAILPVIGKAAVAVGGRAIEKYAGEAIKGEVADLIGGNSAVTNTGELVDAGTSAVRKEVDTLVDRAAERLLADYRQRKRSIAFFKEQLGDVVAAIDGSERHAPLYIIIDELDRCRPSYAISMLEEIKHLFDIPGIVFIIALHGRQLERSISAVYGADFKSAEYLQRFFSRRYRLRTPPVDALARELYAQVGASDGAFHYPEFWHNEEIKVHPPEILIGRLLTHWRVSPRHILAVMDCLRLFVSQWQEAVPIQLPLVLNLIVNWITRPAEEHLSPMVARGERFKFFFQSNDMSRRQAGQWDPLEPGQLFSLYVSMMQIPLPQLAGDRPSRGPEGYLLRELYDEFNKIHHNSVLPDGPLSIWTTYAERVDRIGRFAAPMIEQDEID